MAELFRVTRQSDTGLAENAMSQAWCLVVGNTLPGRGAWLCADSPTCIDLADKRKSFSRALRGPVRQDSIESLRAAMVERARIGRDVDHDCGD